MKLRDFGVRMLPSGGKRFFVHCQHRREPVWKIVGDAATLTVEEARSRAGEIGRLRKVLDTHAGRRKRFRQPADIVRLLLLSGCRLGRNRDPAPVEGGLFDLGEARQFDWSYDYAVPVGGMTRVKAARSRRLR